MASRGGSKAAAAGRGEKPPRIPLREQQKQFTYQRLLEAAVVVFSEKGYGPATIDDVAVEAGVNRGTIYLHFKNKRDVAEALFTAMRPSAEAESARLDDALAEGSREAVREWLRTLLAWYEDNRGAVIALEHVVLEGGFEAAGLDGIYLDSMPRLAARWGPERRDELRMRLWLLTHMMTRVFVVGRVDGLLPEVNEELIIELISELWHSGLHLGEEALPPIPR